MNKFLLLLLLLLFSSATFAKYDIFPDVVAVGDNVKPEGGAAFVVQSTTLGSLPCPKMTQAEREDLPVKPTGGCIFNTTASSTQYYNGSSWLNAGSSAVLSSWLTGTVYGIGTFIYDPVTFKIYVANTAHTAGATLAADIALGYWDELSDGVDPIVLSTDNAIVRWDGATGDLIQDSGVIIDDSDNITGVNNLTVSGTTTLDPALTGIPYLTAGVLSATGITVDGSDNVTMAGDITVFSGTSKALEVGDELLETLSTGVTSPNGLAINGGDPTKYDISATSGHIVDRVLDTYVEIAYAGSTLNTPATSDGVTYVFIDKLGAVTTQTTRPTGADRREKIYLGRVVTIAGTVVQVLDEPVVIENVASSVYDLAKALRIFNIEGNIFTANGANLNLNKSAGSLFSIGSNYITSRNEPHKYTFASCAACTFAYATQLSGSTGADTLLFDPANYDLAGVITAIGGASKQATIQRVYGFPSGNIRIQYGQNIYADIPTALQNISTESYTINPNTPGNGVLLAVIVARRDATDLSDSSQARVLIASRFGEGAVAAAGQSVSSLQDAYNNSSDGEIVLDAVNTSVEIRDASTPIASPLLEVLSFDSLTNYFSVDTGGITLGATTKVNAILDEDGLVSDSATALATQQSIKAYADTKVSFTGVETLTNKTFDDQITMQEIATPATPAAGYKSIYPKTDGKLYSLDDAGNEIEIGSGGGGGGINYLNAANDNSTFEISVGDWVAFNDGSVTVPVDGTGGTSTVGFSCTRNTTTPIRGDGDLQITTPTASDTQGEGCSVDFDIDKGMQAQKLTIELWDDLSNPNLNDDEFAVFIYDRTNANIIRVNGEDLKGGEGRAFAQFQTASNSTAYRLIIMNVDATNTSARNLYFDQIAVSPTNLARGNIITDWKTYTPTLSNFGNATSKFAYRRIGASIHINGSIEIGSTLPTGNLTFSLPSGLNADYTSNPTLGLTSNEVSYQVVGIASTYNNYFTGSVTRNNTNTNDFIFVSTSGSIWNATIPFTWDDSKTIQFSMEVPIQGWSSDAVQSSDLGGSNISVFAPSKSGNQTITAGAGVTTITNWSNPLNDKSGSLNQVTGIYSVKQTGNINIKGSVVYRNSATVTGNAYLVLVSSLNGQLDRWTVDQFGVGNGDYTASVSAIGYTATKGETLYLQMATSSQDITVQSGRGNFGVSQVSTGQTILETERVSFSAEDTSGQTINSTISAMGMDTVREDSHGGFNGTDTYTISINGKYAIAGAVSFDVNMSTSQYGTCRVRINTNYRSYDVDYGIGVAKTFSLSTYAEEDLVKGDTVQIYCESIVSATLTTVTGRNNFSLHRIK